LAVINRRSSLFSRDGNAHHFFRRNLSHCYSQKKLLETKAQAFAGGLSGGPKNQNRTDLKTPCAVMSQGVCVQSMTSSRIWFFCLQCEIPTRQISTALLYMRVCALVRKYFARSVPYIRLCHGLPAVHDW